MKHQQQLTEWTESIIKITERWKGKKIKIQISLTDRDFDRHGTSFIYFSMIFESFFVRTSGVKMMFLGQDNELVEISTDNLQAVEVKEYTTENQIICIEKLGKNTLQQDIFRKVELTLM